MKYLAKIENGIVDNVIVADFDFEPDDGGIWVLCSEDKYPSIGDTYTPEEGFRSPKIFDSWIWNDTETYWEAPIPIPDEENIYEWDEGSITWIMTYKKV